MITDTRNLQCLTYPPLAVVNGEVKYIQLSERTVFNPNHIDQNPQTAMFSKEAPNIQRYDIVRNQNLNTGRSLIEQNLWRVEEIDLTSLSSDWDKLDPVEQRIFYLNIQYQTLMDSVQGRAPTIFAEASTLPEMEAFANAWTYNEQIHSLSYTGLIRAIRPDDPGYFFDNIITNDAILKRAADISFYYDEFKKYLTYHLMSEDIEKDFGIKVEIDMDELRRRFICCLFSVWGLEAIRFFVSFACTFSFGHRKKMLPACQVIQLISRDEFLHYGTTMKWLNEIARGVYGEDLKRVWFESRDYCFERIFMSIYEQESEWINILFQEGEIVGLTSTILRRYLRYQCNRRLKESNLYPEKGYIFPDDIENPIPWINDWLKSSNSQPAPQEIEITTYQNNQTGNVIDQDQAKEFEGAFE